MLKLLLLILTLFLTGSLPKMVMAAEGKLSLSPYFSDNMVLQREKKIPLFGTASKNTEIIVNLADKTVKTRSDAEGKWSVEFPQMSAGGPFALNVNSGKDKLILKDIMIGDVWICAGQSNMAYSLGNNPYSANIIKYSNFPKIRYAKVKFRLSHTPETEFAESQTNWVCLSPQTAAAMSGVAYSFATTLQPQAGVTIGIVIIAKPGSFIEGWIPASAADSSTSLQEINKRWEWLEKNHAALEEMQDKKIAEWSSKYLKRFEQWRQTPISGPFKPERPYGPPSKDGALYPASLYNGMVHPATQHPAKGVVWYQGESNSDRAYQYRFLIRDFIKSWRKAWKNDELPMIFVQLPNYQSFVNPYDHQDGGPWYELRESQTYALKEPHTSLAVTLGLGQDFDVHPSNKTVVGKRAGNCALKLAYNKEIDASAPSYANSSISEQKMTIKLTDTGKGLQTLDGQPVKGFTIAGDDKEFYPASAKIIDGETIEISSEHVTAPVAARYAWEDAPLCNLAGSNGILVSSFRTDNWELLTQHKTTPYWWLSLEK